MHHTLRDMFPVKYHAQQICTAKKKHKRHKHIHKQKAEGILQIISQ